jgi:ABC-type antimicrobial peptide transport system permease subunit
MVLLAHSSGSSAALVGPLRQLIRELDASQPVYNIRTMENLYQSRAVTIANVITDMVGSMGLMGLVLALVGVYGLVAYSVSRRTREIAIRFAVGAQHKQVLGSVLLQAVMLAFSGIVLGLVGSFWASNYLQSIFSDTYTTRSTITTCSLVAAVLLFVTIAAAYIPARRASQVDPIVALRND